MTVYIALLRGVNVGGHNKLPMKELTELCARLGLEDVRTYIQSGNIVFRSSIPPSDIAATVHAGIAERFGFDIPVMVFDADEWGRILSASPYGALAAEDPAKVLVTLLDGKPAESQLEKLSGVVSGDEEFHLDGRALYLRLPQGAGRSKLAARVAAANFKTPATARNWRTMLKLEEMAQSLDG